jgi:hypothetical protein
MSAYPASSIPLSSNIGTTDIADVFPTHLDFLGRGGFRAVADNTERDAITTERRSFGMLVGTQDQNPAVVYQLCNIAMGGVSDDLFDNANWIVFAIAGPSGGLQKETPSGTINDSNVTFTVANEPFFINVNGGIYEVGDGIYLSYSSGTITLAAPVGTGGFIKSYYQ